MFLVKKGLKPIGPGSIVNVSNNNLKLYNQKKSGTFNDNLTDRIFLILSRVNSSNSDIFRVIPVYDKAHVDNNALYFLQPGKKRLTFLYSSIIEDSRKSYEFIFGKEGRIDVQIKILRTHGISISKA